MSFDRVKFNLLVIFMVTLMVFTVGFSSLESKVDLEGVDVKGSMPEVDIPDVPDASDEAPQIELPSIRQPKQLLDYSLKLFLNGKGYVSRETQKMTTNISIGPFKGEEVQETITKRKYSGGIYLEQSWAYSKTGHGENFYRQFYCNIPGDSVEYIRPSKFSYSNESYDLSSGTVQKMTLNETAEKFSVYPGKFSLKMVNASYSGVRGEVSNNGKYFIITVDYKKSAVPEELKALYYKSGPVVPGSVEYTKDIRLMFYINSKTGKLIQYSLNSEFLADLSILSIKGARFTNVCSEVFEKMDEEFEVERPVSNM